MACRSGGQEVGIGLIFCQNLPDGFAKHLANTMRFAELYPHRSLRNLYPGIGKLAVASEIAGELIGKTDA